MDNSGGSTEVQYTNRLTETRAVNTVFMRFQLGTRTSLGTGLQDRERDRLAFFLKPENWNKVELKSNGLMYVAREPSHQRLWGFKMQMC